MNPYDILGIDSSASDEEIKNAYKEKAKESHPDAGGDSTEMVVINLAYEILKNPEKRKKFDQGEDPNKKDNKQEIIIKNFIGMYVSVLEKYNFRSDFTTYIKKEMKAIIGNSHKSFARQKIENNTLMEKYKKQKSFIKNPDDFPNIYAVSFINQVLIDLEKKNLQIDEDTDNINKIAEMIEKFNIEEIELVQETIRKNPGTFYYTLGIDNENNQ